MKNQLPLIAIVSVFTKDQSFRENHESHWDLCNSLTDERTKFIEVTGTYNGTEELAVVVADPAKAKALASVYCQDCIFIRYPGGSCYLEATNDPRTEYIGEWNELTGRPEFGDFTQIDDRFFSTKIYTNRDEV